MGIPSFLIADQQVHYTSVVRYLHCGGAADCNMSHVSYHHPYLPVTVLAAS